MSLDAAIQHGKELRRPYYRRGRYDRTCRPHGSCDYCRDSRQHQQHVQQERRDLRRGLLDYEDEREDWERHADTYVGAIFWTPDGHRPPFPW